MKSIKYKKVLDHICTNIWLCPLFWEATYVDVHRNALGSNVQFNLSDEQMQAMENIQ